MIVEFSVKNFRSIKDMQTISFRATKLNSNPKEHPDVDKNNVVEVGGMRLLKTVGIYGANASGKSNVLMALRLFSIAINAGAVPNDRQLAVLYKPFLFQESPEKTDVFFQIVVELEEKKYRYGFTVSKVDSNDLISPKYIISNEWLYGTKDKNQGKYFVREGIKVDKKSLPNAENIPPIPHPHALFLTHACSFIAHGIIHKIRNFCAGIYGNYLNNESLAPVFSIKDIGYGDYKQRLIEFMSMFDLNYSDVYVEEQAKLKHDYKREYVWLKKHSKEVNLEIHESEGTKKLFDIAGLLLFGFKERKRLITPFLFTLDEIDSNFHPALVIKLVQMFNDPEINKTNAQLLFTSHDTNLLDPAIMRRDQFYFTEKDEQDATRLYSLADLKGIRNDADFARQYLAGYYGAVPMLKDFKNELIAENV